MRALDRKLLRDLVRLRGQVISIALVVAAGVMAAITMRSTLTSLVLSRDGYYRDYRMADVFVSLDRAPESVVERIRDLPGVAAVSSRVVVRAVLSIPGLDRTATGHIVSVPDQGRPVLGDLYLRAGRWVEPHADDEVLMSERFAGVNGLVVGDTISAVLNGRYRALRVVGLAMSPEFVYEVDAGAGFLNDPRLFGVVWMGREALAAADDRTGSFNELAVRLAPGASEQAVIDEIDVALDAYGGLGAYGRADQISNRLVSDEIEQIRGTATVIPVIFLAVAAFLLNIVLARLIALERGPIATLKAFGYTNARVAGHYLEFALAAVGVGAILGMIAGFAMGAAYTQLYSQYFRFPALRYHASWDVAFGAVVISAIAALGGAWSAVRAAARLQPAEGMRPEAPANFRPLFLERFGLHRWLSPAQRMILRNLERRPLRAFLSSMGVAAAFAVLATGLILMDSMNGLIVTQFERVQKEDLAVTFTSARDIDAAREIGRVPGIVHAEPFHMVPVRLARGQRERRLALTGIVPESRLRAMVDADGWVHPLPRSGVVLTASLATALHAGPGDTIVADLLDRGGEERTLVVAATMNEAIGINAYLTLDELSRVTRDGPRASGAWVTLERGAETAVLRRLREIPAVGGATSKAAMLESFDDQIARSFTIVAIILLSLAAILAIGIVYNGARIALSERGRELASLRVLGFSRPEVASMLLGEQAIITLIGLPLGMLFGIALTMGVLGAVDTELYRVPIVLRPATFVRTSLMILVVAAGAGLLVRRRLDRADLIAVLKTRE